MQTGLNRPTRYWLAATAVGQFVGAPTSAAAPCESAWVALEGVTVLQAPRPDAARDGELYRGERVSSCPDPADAPYVRVRRLSDTDSSEGPDRYVELPVEANADYAYRVARLLSRDPGPFADPTTAAPEPPPPLSVCRWAWLTSEAEAPAMLAPQSLPSVGTVRVWPPGAPEQHTRVESSRLQPGPQVPCELAGASSRSFPVDFRWQATLREAQTLSPAIAAPIALAAGTTVLVSKVDAGGWALARRGEQLGWLPLSSLRVDFQVMAVEALGAVEHSLASWRRYRARRPLRLIDCDSGAPLAGPPIAEHATLIAEPPPDWRATNIDADAELSSAPSQEQRRVVFLGRVGCVDARYIEPLSQDEANHATFWVDYPAPLRPSLPPPPAPRPRPTPPSRFGVFAGAAAYAGSGGLSSASGLIGASARLGRVTLSAGGGIASRLGASAYGVAGMLAFDVALGERLALTLRAEYQNHTRGDAPHSVVAASPGLSFTVTEGLDLLLGVSVGGARVIESSWDELTPVREETWKLAFGGVLGVTGRLPL